jgi:hypothetical protein
MIIFLIYLVGFLVASYTVEFKDERPTDKFLAGLFWPVILGIFAWHLWCGRLVFYYRGKIIHRGRNVK